MTPPARRTTRTNALDVADRLNSVAIHLLRRISREDGADGLSGARAKALSVIVYRGPMTGTELARREGVSTPTITRMIDALARDGLVSRTQSGADRREVPIEATAAGRRLMERGRSRRIKRLAGELGRLSAAELDTLGRAVALLEGLEQQEEES